MKYKILIDKNTIRENPNAGKSKLIEQLPANFSIGIDCCDNFCKKLNLLSIKPFYSIYNPVSTLQEMRFNNLTSQQLEIIRNLIEENADSVDSYSYEQKNNFVVHQHHPQPSYLYEYQPTLIECEECHAKFKHTYLKTEDEYDNCSYTVCPVCETWNCCEIEYQSIEEALEESK